MKLAKPHRLARLHYAPRVASFGLLVFVGSLLLMREGLVDTALLPLAVLLFLVYPHLVFLHACASRRDGRLARRTLVLDAVLLGAWLPVVGFNLGLGFAMIAAVMLNTSMAGGWRLLLSSVGALVAGTLTVGWLTGFRFEPLGSIAATLMGLAGILVYMTIVAEMFHRQAVQLFAVLRESAAKRKLFEALAGAGLDAASASSIDAIVDIVLDQLASVLPQGQGVGIVVRDRIRTRLRYCAAFRGVPTGQQAVLLAGVDRRQHSSSPAEAVLATDDDGWVFVGGTAGSLEALCVVSGDPLDDTGRRTVSIFLRQLAVMLENHALTSQLRALANTDGLTGLANRTRFDECLADAIVRKRRNPDSDFSIIAADINGLKGLNDSRGHEAGDHLILAAARLLRATCRDTDLVARIGGDEFVVLCPATRVREATRLIERLRRRMAAQRAEQATIAVSLSIGAADSSETDAAKVMNLADQRMYSDKQAFYRARDQP